MYGTLLHMSHDSICNVLPEQLHFLTTSPLMATFCFIQIGMCFMTPVCNISEQLTCHRYKPDPSATKGGKYAAVRLSEKKGHYNVYSSYFDGFVVEN